MLSTSHREGETDMFYFFPLLVVCVLLLRPVLLPHGRVVLQPTRPKGWCVTVAATFPLEIDFYYSVKTFYMCI